MDLRTTVNEAVTTVAPELRAEDLSGDARLQEDLDLDSMDFLDVIAELTRRTGVEIPERDYPQLSTIDGCVTYLGTHTDAAA